MNRSNETINGFLINYTAAVLQEEKGRLIKVLTLGHHKHNNMGILRSTNIKSIENATWWRQKLNSSRQKYESGMFFDMFSSFAADELCL